MKTPMLFCLLILAAPLAGQSLSPQVVATTGFPFSDGHVHIDWTVGQVSTATLSSNGHRITQGFQQPFLMVTAVENQSHLSGISVFPNPTGHFLNIEFLKDFDEKTLLILSDFNGRTLLVKERLASDFLIAFDLSNFPDAAYLLTIRQVASGQTSSFKIIKTNVK